MSGRPDARPDARSDTTGPVATEAITLVPTGLSACGPAVTLWGAIQDNDRVTLDLVRRTFTDDEVARSAIALFVYACTLVHDSDAGLDAGRVEATAIQTASAVASEMANRLGRHRESFAMCREVAAQLQSTAHRRPLRLTPVPMSVAMATASATLLHVCRLRGLSRQQMLGSLRAALVAADKGPR